LKHENKKRFLTASPPKRMMAAKGRTGNDNGFTRDDESAARGLARRVPALAGARVAARRCERARRGDDFSFAFASVLHSKRSVLLDRCRRRGDELDGPPRRLCGGRGVLPLRARRGRRRPCTLRHRSQAVARRRRRRDTAWSALVAYAVHAAGGDGTAWHRRDAGDWKRGQPARLAWRDYRS